jgi:hypothetical protein
MPQVWDGANRKWEKALELQAMSVGSKRVAFTGNPPRGINADKLGEFVRRGFRFENGRAVYEAVECADRAMWYCNKYWYIGQAQDLGKPQGWLCCKDDAACPELCKATWRVSDGQQMIDAEDVACMPVGAMTVMVAGETPSNLNSDKLGEFVRQVRRKQNEKNGYRVGWAADDRRGGRGVHARRGDDDHGCRGDFHLISTPTSWASSCGRCGKGKHRGGGKYCIEYSPLP